MLPPNVVGFFLRVFQKLNEIFVVLAVAYAKFVVNVFFLCFWLIAELFDVVVLLSLISIL